jgi:DNA-binding beta-propeller fold protein YncE
MKSALILCFVALTASTCKRQTNAAAQPADTVKPQQPRTTTQKVSRDGIDLSLSMHVASEKTSSHAQLMLSLTDSTGSALNGVRPLAWLGSNPSGQAVSEAQCKEKIRGYLSGAMTSQAAVDFNGRWLLALNEDATVGVINPQVALSRTKLEHTVRLPDTGADWLLHPDGNRLLVTIPKANLLSLVDLKHALAVGKISTGKQPTRLALSPNLDQVFVGNDGEASVSVINLSGASSSQTLPVGPGHHELLVDQHQRLWVTSSGSRLVHVFDTADTSKETTLAVDPQAVALAYGPLADAIFVASERTGRIQSFSQVDLRPLGQSQLKPGIMKLAFEPNGRFLFVINAAQNEVSVIDTSSPQLASTTIKDLSRPDGVFFTSRYAYIRNQRVSDMHLVDLNSLDKGSALVTLTIPFGQQAPAAVPNVGIASPMVLSPEGNGVLAVNPANKATYVYSEGMMAPIGTIKTSGRQTMALLSLDKSIQPNGEGTYIGKAPVPHAGDYTLAVFVDSPRFFSCVPWKIEPSSSLTATNSRHIEIEPPSKPIALMPIRVNIQVSTPNNAEPKEPEPLSAIVTSSTGHWQTRPLVKQTNNTSSFVEFTVPDEGWYQVFVRSAKSDGAMPRSRFYVAAAP